MRGTSGNDVFRIRAYSGANTVEVIDGQGGSDTIEGNNSNNTLDFSATQLLGITAIYGHAGNDNLSGSAGDDVLSGGTGNDYLTGLNGADIYLIAANDGSDRIQDGGADSATDRIRFASGVSPNDIWFYQYGNELRIYLLGANNYLRITNYFSDSTQLIESIEIDVTDSLDTSTTAFTDLVALMTSLGEPSGGAIALTPEQQQQVADAVAGAW